jgi:hypothetical protein
MLAAPPYGRCCGTCEAEPRAIHPLKTETDERHCTTTTTLSISQADPFFMPKEKSKLKRQNKLLSAPWK